MEFAANMLVTFVLPVLGATLAGGLIGLEREYHAHAAGLRTHILVALASVLLMLAAAHQAHWLMDTPRDVIRIDPARMAHGILTGIGFLCGGVIFRQGLSVHGLTTAASLWITSALGTLYGVGLYGLAIGGTVATVVILAAFRRFEAHVPHIRVVDVVVRYRRGDSWPEAEFRALADDLELASSPVTHRLLDGGKFIEFAATFRSRGGHRIAGLAERLCADQRVCEFEVRPRTD